MIRHGECEFLSEGVYNGWQDYILTDKGIKQSCNAATVLKNHNISLDKIYTSVLSRTINTAKNIKKTLNQDDVKITTTYLLNERHYGIFQGKSRKQVTSNTDYLKIYNNLYDGTTKPPEISEDDYNNLIKEYMKILNLSENEVIKITPKSESLNDVTSRIDIFFDSILTPYIRKNINKDKTIMIVSHANPLKLIVKKIEQIPNYEKAMKNLFATCGMYIYELDDESFINHEYIINSKKVLNNNWYA